MNQHTRALSQPTITDCCWEYFTEGELYCPQQSWQINYHVVKIELAQSQAPQREEELGYFVNDNYSLDRNVKPLL